MLDSLPSGNSDSRFCSKDNLTFTLGDDTSTPEVTQLLLAWNEGDKAALDHLIPLVEAELHALAQRYLRGEQAGHTLQATELVNEAYLRLVDWQAVQWQNRAHFIGMAMQLMRHILVDHARHQRAQRHGGGALRVSVTSAGEAAAEQHADVIALNDALSELAAFDERKSRIVELRFFGGLTEEEIAEVMKLPLRTLQREWSLARLAVSDIESGGLKEEKQPTN